MITLVVVAGGKGTRLNSIHTDLPKCLSPVAGKPILEHQLEWAEKFKVEKYVFLLGHLAEQVKEYIVNSRFAEQSVFVTEDEPLGTAGGFRALGEYATETLLVLYGDVLCNFDLNRFYAFHKDKGGGASLFIHPNDHPCDSDLVELDQHGKVTHIHRKPHPEGLLSANLVNAAVYLVESKLLEWLPSGKSDWMHDVFPRFLKSGILLYGYISSEYVKDMGTPDRLQMVSKDYVNGKVERGSYLTARKAIFLDRDGTINREVDRLRSKEDFVLLPNAARAIRRINKSEYLAIVVANQPVVACGFCSVEELADIHKTMDTLLSEGGAYVDALYYCPHHPDKGFPGENKAFKMECKCRKPETGLIDWAKEQHNIDLANSWFIGDTTRDLETGRRAGVKTILVETGYGGQDGAYSALSDYVAKDLNEAVDILLGKEDRA